MNTAKVTLNNPSWWNNEHESAWDRVKEALLRDWEQTKADLTGQKSGRDLNQGIADTLKQAAGQEEVPPPHKQNIPKEPEEASKRIAALGQTIEKANERIADAKDDIAYAEAKKVQATKEARAELQIVREEVQQDLENARKKSEREIAEARAESGGDLQKAQEKVAHAEQRLRDEQQRANEKLARAEKKFAESLVEVRDDAADTIETDKAKIKDAERLRLRAERDRSEVESAMRYGYSVRSRYPNTGWDADVEDELRTEWTSLGARTWDESKADIRHGWDRAGSKS